MRLPVFLLAACVFAAPLSALAYTPNDTLYPSQAYLPRVFAPGAWDVTRGSSDVIVALIDSGTDLTHPDLKDRIWTNPKEIPGNGIDDDADGYVDDVHGWDFVASTNDPEPDLSQGWIPGGADHGTVVAGIVAATADNSQGISGLAPNVRLMPLRVVDAFGRGDSPHVVPAIRYAVDHGAKVINMSFSGTDLDPEFNAEVLRAYQRGVVVVVAAGNTHGGGADLAETPVYPACLRDGDVRPVIGVAATDQNDVRADFSNYGGGCIDIAAPGTDMVSTTLLRPDKTDFTDPYGNGWNGTSFAAPLVSGAAALLLSVHPGLTPDQVRTVLQLSADPVSDSVAGAVGAGRLNVARALQIAGSFDTGSVAPSVASPAPSFPTAVAPDAPLTLPAQAPSPVTGATEAVSELTPGDYVRSPSFSTVYLVTAEGKRRPFLDAHTFLTYAAFSDVKTVTDATLPLLSLGAPMLPKPGTVLVKIQSDPKTYAVTDPGADGKPVLRYIPSETEAIRLYGAAWSDYVIDLPPTIWNRFAFGADVGPSDQLPADGLIPRSALR